MHSHAQPLLAYLRLLGIEPTSQGKLAVGRGGTFESQVFRLASDGHGSASVRGPVAVETSHGNVAGGPGIVRW
jgi:hypothetical protein